MHENSCRRFQNKICIVTGAGQGIGRATAYRLGDEGGTIVVVDRFAESAERVNRELSSRGVRSEAFVTDLANFAGAQDLMRNVTAKYGRIDVLCNVVGGAIWWQPYHLFTKEQISAELDRSLFPTLWCCLAVLPKMIDQGGGSIVNLSSMVTRGGCYRAPYAVSKGGVEALTKTLANEYGEYGIRINAVSPGSTHIEDRVTSRFALGDGRVAVANERHDEYVARGRIDLRRLALGRHSTVKEQAAAIAFLASDDASYMTGQILNCFGGP